MARKRKEPTPIIGAGAREFNLTKLDVAEAHIKTAVTLFFSDSGHPVSIYTLANAAREIVAVIAEKMNVRTVVDDLVEGRGSTFKETMGKGIELANWLKHANRDTTEKLQFNETHVDAMLQIACHDFGRVARGMPIEAQVYEAWVSTLAYKRISDAPFSAQSLLRKCAQHFLGLRSAMRAEQLRMGREVLIKCINDPSLETQFSREVILPNKDSSAEC